MKRYLQNQALQEGYLLVLLAIAMMQLKHYVMVEKLI